MTQDLEALVRRAIDAFNRRDFDAFVAVMDPDVEFTPYEVAVQGGSPYRGHDGVRTWWDESFAVLPDLSAEVHDVRAAGDVTIVCGRLTGQGASSGVSFERPMWLAIRWRDGKEVWWHSYQSKAEALEAAGIRE